MGQVSRKVEKDYGMRADIPNLFEAAATNDVAGIKIALQTFHINDTDGFGMSALHHAAAYGAWDAIDFLLVNEIDAQIKDNFGRLASWVPLEVLGPKLGAPIANRLGPICNDYSDRSID